MSIAQDIRDAAAEWPWGGHLDQVADCITDLFMQPGEGLVQGALFAAYADVDHWRTFFLFVAEALDGGRE